MTIAELLQRVSVDPNVCFGRPCVRGTRLRVSLTLDLPASSVSEAEVITVHPHLTLEDVRAAVGPGAEAVSDSCRVARARRTRAPICRPP